MFYQPAAYFEKSPSENWRGTLFYEQLVEGSSYHYTLHTFWFLLNESFK